MQRPLSLILRFCAIVALGAGSLALIASLTIAQVSELPQAASFEPLSQVALPELPEGSTVLDMNGDRIGELVGSENRQIVTLSEVSEPMKKTVLAVEDADFYEHNGVSAKSILRAVRANSDAGGVSQGGSTITQQLIKLTLVGNEQTLQRKVKEASLAIQLENQLCESVPKRECKSKILEQYLNTVYLGRGSYGIQAAAQTYFGVDASEITWPQAAVLTSLFRNPNGYDPIRFPEVAKTRRHVVLGRLVDEDLLTPDEAAFIDELPLPTEVQSNASSATANDLTYVERQVRDELLDAEWLAPTEELRRYLIFNGGLTVTSTIDPRAQLIASAASAANPVAEANPDTVAVVVSVDPGTGAVRGIVGETEIEGKGLVEIADSSLGRPAGSSFKTFTLAAALEDGHSIRDSISSSPAPRSKYDDWGIDASTWPSGCKGGSLSLSRATASSNNCAFVRLQAAVGGDKVISVAERLGISTVGPSNDVPSLTLGSASVRPLEMAAAYAAIANDGVFNPAHFVSKVEDRDGNVLYEYTPSTTQAIPVDVAREVTSALEGVVSGGTYRGGRLPDGREAAGKSGTNETGNGDNTDVWFVGFTPQIATAVWIGDPRGQINMKGGRVQGGSMAGRVWHDFMVPYLEPLPVVDFESPPRSRSGKYIKDPWRGSSSRSSDRSSSRSSNSSSSRSSRRTTTTTTGGGSGVAPPATDPPAVTAPPATSPPATEPSAPVTEPDPPADP